MRRITLLLIAALAAVLLLAPAALAASPDDPAAPSQFVLPTAQLWTLLAGALVPLVTYVLNHAAPWVTEKIKALVLVVASAIAGAILQLVTAGSIGFDTATLQFVLTAIIAALGAHKLLWQPSTVAAALGGGSNAQDRAS